MEEIKLIAQEMAKDAELQELLTKLELQKQYESQKQMLGQMCLLAIFSSQEQGLTGINDQAYLIPTFEQIVERIKAKQERIKTKAEQGFTKLILVPFGLPLSYIINRYEHALIDHYQKNALKATDGSSLELNIFKRISVSDSYIKFDEQGETTYEADMTGDIVYFPSQFDQTNHQGKTKQELLEENQDYPSGSQAWQVLLLEDLPDLPARNKGKTIGGRKQLEANQSPSEYLDLFHGAGLGSKTVNPYENEQGLTLESWLIYALSQLQEKNQVIDDWEDQGKVCYLIGSYQKKSGNVPNGDWSRDRKRAILHGSDPEDSRSSGGCRSGVMI